MKTPDGPVLFFDGECVLCNRFADILLRIDRHRSIHFATLQGATAEALLSGRSDWTHAEDARSPSSLVFLDEGVVSKKSDAVIRILFRLGGVWRIPATAFRLFPQTFRDAIYDIIARNRFRWFGRRPACRVPDADERNRLLP